MALVMPFLMCSCDPHKRIARIARNHPEVLQKDTLRVDTVIVSPGVRTDTVIRIEHFYETIKDTLRIREDHFKVEIFHDVETDSVYINGQCDTVEIPVEIAIPYEKIVVQSQNWWERNNWWVVILLVLILIFFIWRKARDGIRWP